MPAKPCSPQGHDFFTTDADVVLCSCCGYRPPMDELTDASNGTHPAAIALMTPSESDELVTARHMIGNGRTFTQMREWFKGLGGETERSVLMEYIAGHYKLPIDRLTEKQLARFEDLKGRVLTSIEHDPRGKEGGAGPGKEAVWFTLDTGESFYIGTAHVKPCCEDVELKNHTGVFTDIAGLEITKAIMRERFALEGPVTRLSTEYELSTEKGSFGLEWVGEFDHGRPCSMVLTVEKKRNSPKYFRMAERND